MEQQEPSQPGAAGSGGGGLRARSGGNCGSGRLSNAPQLQRTTFEMSRAAEYFSVAELQAQTGQPASQFAAVLVKELLDNGLDACETAGVAPELSLEVRWLGEELRLTVADNGHGLPPETMRRVLNFATRSSDKAVYRAPTRGAQGNALKTVLGIPHALGGKAPVVIEACGMRHTIRASVDPAGELRVLSADEPLPPTVGTRVQVSLPAVGQTLRADYWAAAFGVFNPHATVRFRETQDGVEHAHGAREGTSEVAKSYHPTVHFPGAWRKFLPTDLTSPWWYNLRELETLVFSHLKVHREGGRDLPLREFVRQFRGLSGTAKAKTVCETVPGITHLSGFDATPLEIARLYTAMREVTAKPPSPEVLGTVGEAHLRTFLNDTFGVKRCWYKGVCGLLPGSQEGLPFTVEVAVAETETPGRLFYGVNFSPTFDDPFSGAWLQMERLYDQGLQNFLKSAHVLPRDTEKHGHTAVVVHLVCPHLHFLDRGKTRLQTPAPICTALGKALWHTVKELYTEAERRKKDAARQERQDVARERPETRKVTMKEVVFAVLPEAMHKASGGGRYPVSARTLFYQVRPLIQPHTAKPLDYDYFAQALLTLYRQEHGPLPGLYYDPRGVLYEPHSGQEVKLGTREVDAYTFPSWLYNKILYVEKKGLWPILQQAQFAERYDMAIIAAEGYASEAARTLFAQADQGQEYQLFVLHDADPDGYNIARTLSEETRRMPGYQVQVHDLGLRLEEALSLGLATESFTRKKALPAGLVLSDVEQRHFGGQQASWGKHPSWVCQRVELNAFNAPDLVAYIERQLVAVGAVGKVIPSAEALPPLALAGLREEVSTWVDDTLAEWFAADRLKRELVDLRQSTRPLGDLRPEITAALARQPVQAWRQAMRGLLREHVAQGQETLTAALRSGIAEASAE